MRRRQRSKQSGSIFVVSVVVLGALISILALAASSQHAYAQSQIHRMEMRKSGITTDAGLQRALAELQDQVNSPTTLNDEWALLGQNGNEAFQLGSATFRIQIIDAASKVNLNTATQAQLEQLPLTAEQVDCILDWREDTTNPRPDGAKDQFYNQLEVPYNAKLGPFQSVDELLMVKGFTAQDLYTVRTDVVNTAQPVRTSTGGQVQLPLEELLTVDSISQAVNAQGQAKLNINQATATQIAGRGGVTMQIANQIVTRRPAGGYANIGDALGTPGITLQSARTLLSNCTTGGQNQTGKINLNTATEEVLLTVPNLPPDVASAIVTRQSQGFTELGDLLDVPGMNNIALLQQTAGFFEVNSQTFLVRVLAQIGSTRVAMQATVLMQNGAARVVRIEQPPYANVLEIWGWEDQPVATTTLKGSQ